MHVGGFAVTLMSDGATAAGCAATDVATARLV
ncbi:hypothetical protein ABIA95_005444 [Bradyrhizobium sp. LA8.1]